MNTGLPAGLASVIAPLQPVFTIPLAVVALGERPSLRQVAGVSLALAGLGTIAAGRAATQFRAARASSRRTHRCWLDVFGKTEAAGQSGVVEEGHVSDLVAAQGEDDHAPGLRADVVAESR